MGRDDYERVLTKIEQKNKQKVNDFLRSLPFLTSWTNTALNKLQLSFETKNFFRNQMVYREGTVADVIYIVKEGEFELTKLKTHLKEQSYKYDKLLGPQKTILQKKAELDKNVISTTN